MPPVLRPALVALSLIALAQPALAAESDLVKIGHGRLLVERNCGMCHAVGRAGESRDPQAPPFRRLHERFDVEELGEALAEGILTGHPAMPEFRFEPDEVVAIIAYL